MLDTLLHATQGVFTIVIMVATGWILTHIGWMGENESVFFSRLILKISFPCYMLWNLTSNFDRYALRELSSGLIVPFTSMLASYFLSVVISKLAKISIEHRGIFRSIFFTSNTIFIGLPVNLALFGEKSTPYALIYYIANTCLFWTLANYEISKDGNLRSAGGIFSLRTLKQLINPPICVFVFTVLLILAGIQLPSFITNSCRYIGELTTPLAMFFIGIVLHSIPLKKLRLNKELGILLFGRFIISPLLVVALERIFILPPLMSKVFIIQSAMPAVTSTGAIAKQYGSDYEYATIATAITTLCSIIVIPVYMILI
ncbi:AEC family transporter [Oscillibacter sp. GMB15532]|uniref:AEC family transporter n=1 Tax=Oscillibacter sp. GMB15532 TaxID=3230022 RepID=UPI0034E00DCD